MSISHDPFDAATQAGEGRNAFYGRADVSAAFVTLKKGVGKQPFNEQFDDMRDRRTEVKIVVNPIDAMGLTILLQRDLIAESSEWSKFTWASLRDKCGLKNVRELNGKWCKLTLVSTGETYTTKRGDTQERKAFVFEAVYQTAQEAEAAYYADTGTAPVDSEMAIDMSHGAGTAPSTNGANGNGANPERETALQFLKVLVKQANGDRGKLAASIAQMPMIAKWFTIDSPEVGEILAGVA
jgi:hypothetical protein